MQQAGVVDLRQQFLQEMLRVFVFPLDMEDTRQGKDRGCLERLALELPANGQRLRCLLPGAGNIIPFMGKLSQAKPGPLRFIPAFGERCLIDSW